MNAALIFWFLFYQEKRTGRKSCSMDWIDAETYNQWDGAYKSTQIAYVSKEPTPEDNLS